VIDMRSALILFSTILVAGCASPTSQLRAGLIDAGLSSKQSSCMAERMVDKLSLFQLKRLSSLSNLKDESIRTVGVDRFLYNIRSLQDPEILSVTTRAALGCAISG
jgi:hypothetical protein